jgi:hypothetical protein
MDDNKWSNGARMTSMLLAAIITLAAILAAYLYSMGEQQADLEKQVTCTEQGGVYAKGVCSWSRP